MNENEVSTKGTKISTSNHICHAEVEYFAQTR